METAVQCSRWVRLQLHSAYKYSLISPRCFCIPKQPCGKMNAIKYWLLVCIQFSSNVYDAIHIFSQHSAHKPQKVFAIDKNQLVLLGNLHFLGENLPIPEWNCTCPRWHFLEWKCPGWRVHPLSRISSPQLFISMKSPHPLIFLLVIKGYVTKHSFLFLKRDGAGR